MAQTMERTMDCQQVAARQADLSRKFDGLDVEEDVALADAAEAYARSYDGDFEFMVSMKEVVHKRGYLSPNQAKGVLNTMAAAGRKAAAPVVAPVEERPLVGLATLVEGVYAVEDSAGRLVTLRVSKPGFGSFPDGTYAVAFKNDRIEDDERKWVGFAFVSQQNGVKVWRKQQMAVSQLQALLSLCASADPLAYGFAYSLLSGRCFVCDAALDDPVSIKSGIGPVCAKKLGVKRESLTIEERAKAAKLRAIEAA